MGPLIQNYTDLKYNILVAIAVSWSKRVDAIGRRRPVEHHWFIRGMSEIVLDLTPLRGGGGGGGGGGRGGQKVLLIIVTSKQLTLTHGKVGYELSITLDLIVSVLIHILPRCAYLGRG